MAEQKQQQQRPEDRNYRIVHDGVGTFRKDQVINFKTHMAPLDYDLDHLLRNQAIEPTDDEVNITGTPVSPETINRSDLRPSITPTGHVVDAPGFDRPSVGGDVQMITNQGRQVAPRGSPTPVVPIPSAGPESPEPPAGEGNEGREPRGGTPQPRGGRNR